ncbi:MAG: hypothetical protein LBH55_01190 [Mycoplasmataceae bacterium]|jgi:hypothetical protein|nr:hypothetical protein [Mycoplasmataceae bacterium]
MKVGLKLFAGLFMMGTVATIVPTVLTSCKSNDESKQHEDSFTFNKDNKNDIAAEMKNFLNSYKINPDCTGLTGTDFSMISGLGYLLTNTKKLS